eukprot:TRINITY_DN32781_c0_g1_i1.p1 TRINITY_DN32781_c0_g1~~TRINITY_DN32781_c0_g1_i1.p1  ORF type:complete len:423 (+),score=80.76 TRINITY_DN32781_c0_g1_i1:28-1269(+)
MGGKNRKSGGKNKSGGGGRSKKSGGSKPAVAASSRGAGGGKGSRGKGGAGASGARHDQREEEKTRSQGKPVKRKHGGDQAVQETHERLRVKIVERQIKRLRPGCPPEERCQLLQELGQMHHDAGRTRLATENFKEVLLNLPEDPNYVRTTLLCLYMDQAKSQEARDLLLSPLFVKLLLDKDVSAKLKVTVSEKDAEAAMSSPEGRLAAVVGCYSLALLTYLSVCVLDEAKPSDKAASQQRLMNRMRRAHSLNPYCAELIAFYPAFEEFFPEGFELPDIDTCTPEETPLRDALEYCCRLGQMAVWLDSDDDVRRFLQKLLFEDEVEAKPDEEEKPPFAPIPDEQPNEPLLIAKWRKARNAAMELWATEMSVDGSDAEVNGSDLDSDVDQGEGEGLGECAESEECAESIDDDAEA